MLNLPCMDAVECTTGLEVRLLAALQHERRLRKEREAEIAWLKAERPLPPVHVTVELKDPEPPKLTGTRLERLPGNQAKISDIQEAVGERFGFTVLELKSDRRTRKVAEARQVAVMLSYALTLHSYPQIGRQFGGRDHTTMLHSVNKFKWLLALLRAELTPEDSVATWAKHAHEHIMAGPFVAPVLDLEQSRKGKLRWSKPAEVADVQGA